MTPEGRRAAKTRWQRSQRYAQRTDTSLVTAHLPCADCGSSDALSIFSDDHTHCFSCGKTIFPRGLSNEPGETMADSQDLSDDVGSDIPRGTVGALKSRALHEETCNKWGYLQGTMGGKPCQIAQYRDNDTGAVIAAKVRFPDKTFTFVGTPKRAGLYGQWLWA